MFALGKDKINSEILVKLANSRSSRDWTIDPSTWIGVEKSRAHVEACLKNNETVYGINTGFGFLSNVSITNEKLAQLQLNLIRSHACGVGKALSKTKAKAMFILKLHNLLHGYSGISKACLETMAKMLENDIIPVVPEQGSVGASGDLAPLAHIGLTLIGEGQVYADNYPQPCTHIFKLKNLEPYKLRAKEGLAIINGTQFIATLGSFAVEEAKTLMKSADVIAAISLDTMRGSIKPFDERLQQVRPHKGQIDTAQNFRKIFSDPDEILVSHEACHRVQDPYSFRCIPQVHGACRNGIEHTEAVLNIELNSTTDNPVVFNNGDIISGGNFHGEPMALPLDYLTMCVSELGNISERRIEKLTNPNFSELPAFLSKDSGVNSGFMIPHVVAAALASENKTLCHPASVDSIPTSADKEDHVSMGPISARKAIKVCEHVSKILAIELLTACQGLDFLKPLEPCTSLKTIYNRVRELSPEMTADRALYQEIEAVARWISKGGILDVFEELNIELV